VVRYWFSTGKETWLIDDKYYYMWWLVDETLEVSLSNTVMARGRLVANTEQIYSLIPTIFQAKSIEVK
jgi:hypothetical protein